MDNKASIKLDYACVCRFIDDKGFVLGNDGVLLRYLG